MIKQVLALFATLCLYGYSSEFVHLYKSGEQTKVYVVMSTNAYAYHKTRSCKAVQKATHKVKEVTIDEARSMGREPCKMCYK